MKIWRNIMRHSFRRRVFSCGVESGAADMSAPGARHVRGMPLNVKAKWVGGNREYRQGDKEKGRQGEKRGEGTRQGHGHRHGEARGVSSVFPVPVPVPLPVPDSCPLLLVCLLTAWRSGTAG